jgi:hypothetical protein
MIASPAEIGQGVECRRAGADKTSCNTECGKIFRRTETWGSMGEALPHPRQFGHTRSVMHDAWLSIDFLSDELTTIGAG